MPGLKLGLVHTYGNQLTTEASSQPTNQAQDFFLRSLTKVGAELELLFITFHGQKSFGSQTYLRAS